MSAKTCDLCVFGYKFDKRLPQDITDWGCSEENWGGYTDPAAPACGGIKFSSRQYRQEMGAILAEALAKAKAAE